MGREYTDIKALTDMWLLNTVAQQRGLERFVAVCGTLRFFFFLRC